MMVESFFVLLCKSLYFARHSIHFQDELDRNKFRVLKSCMILSRQRACENRIQYNSAYPDVGYPDRLGPSGKFVENSTKLTCLKITGYPIKYSTVLWLVELQVRCGRKV